MESQPVARSRQAAPTRGAFRFPALIVLVLFAAGVLADWGWGGEFLCWSLQNLLLLQGGLLVFWGVLFRQKNSLSGFFWAGLVVVSGAAWHHLFFHVLPADHIRPYVREAPEAFHLKLRILTEPAIQKVTLPRFTAARPLQTTTRFEAEILEFMQNSQPTRATGKVLVTVVGELEGYRSGEVIRALGMLRRTTAPRNPAMYHFAESQKRKQIYLALHCHSAAAIDSLEQPKRVWSDRFWEVRKSVRQRVRQVFQQALPEETRALGIALVLGERQELDSHTKEVFQKSGLMHVLSISGLHVGLMAWVCYSLGRIFRLRPHDLMWAMLSGMTACLVLAETEAPVLRAWIIGVVFVLSWNSKRPSSGWISLVGSAWLILLINPTWLFEPGTQLSFLAMVGIFLTGQLFPRLLRNQEFRPAFEETQDESENSSEGSFWDFKHWVSLVKRWCQPLGTALLISLGITLLMFPLLGHYFYFLTLSGIPATVLSMPPVAVLMALLLVLGIVGLFSTSLAALVAWPVHGLLLVLKILAEQFSGYGLLGWTSVRPSLTVVLLCYAGLAGWFFLRWRKPTASPKIALAVWGLAVLIIFEGHHLTKTLVGFPLECRVLSIGHGNACLVKTPQGKTLLFDAGSLENGSHTANVIRASLADMQADRIDAIVISHTDLDHLNAVPFLLEQIPVQQIFMNPVGLSPKHRGMLAVAETAVRLEVPLRILQPDDQLILEPGLSVQVIQGYSSPAEYPGSDNAASLVLEVEYAGKRLLFPGDIAGAGQEQLLKTPAKKTDLLVAPHHGSVKENTKSFANWARAEVVAISAGFSFSPESLKPVYEDGSQLLLTSQGTIRYRVFSNGQSSLEQWGIEQKWKPAIP